MVNFFEYKNSAGASIDGPYTQWAYRVIDDLKSLGIPIKNNSVTEDELKKMVKQQKYEGLLCDWTTPEPTNPKLWAIPEIDGHFDAETLKRGYTEEARRLKLLHGSTLYSERRRAIEQQLEQIYYEQLPTIPLFIGNSNSLHKSTLRGWNPMGSKEIYWNSEDWTLVQQ